MLEMTIYFYFIHLLCTRSTIQ